jgi:hypothetical protein
MGTVLDRDGGGEFALCGFCLDRYQEEYERQLLRARARQSRSPYQEAGWHARRWLAFEVARAAAERREAMAEIHAEAALR